MFTPPAGALSPALRLVLFTAATAITVGGLRLSLYEHAPCGYLSTLPDGTIVKVNGTFVEWTGAARDVLLAGTKFQTLLSIGSRIYYETHYAPLLRMQGFANELALEITRQDGRILPVLVNSRQKCDERGTPLFHRIMLFDATDRRRYERELLLARRKAEQIANDKADLIAMLSHDIRNPLNAVMGVVQMIERSGLDEPQLRLVRLLKSSSDNMLNLLNRVLELSRAESGSFTLRELPTSVRAIVDEVVATFEPVAREKGVAVGSVIAPDVPQMVIGDPVALRQVFTNLVANAVKFTAVGLVSVAVSARDIGTDAVTMAVAVSDTGIGITRDEIERIFDAFAQAGHDTPARFGGTGLGLTITRRLLALYGSTVEVRSTPGEGSTFSFTMRLPLPAAERRSPEFLPEREPKAHPRRTRRARAEESQVLVVAEDFVGLSEQTERRVLGVEGVATRAVSDSVRVSAYRRRR